MNERFARGGGWRLSILAAVWVAGCATAPPPPTPRTFEGKGKALSHTRMPFDGVVGKVEYGPFETGPITLEKGTNSIIAATTMSKAYFKVAGPKMENVSAGLTLVRVASEGLDLTKPPQRERFVEHLHKLFDQHREVREVYVMMDRVIIPLHGQKPVGEPRPAPRRP